MNSAAQSETRQAITRAFERLPLIAGIEYEIPSAVDTVLLWVRPTQVVNHFADLGKSGVEAEISKIATLAKSLQSAINDMHRPTFDLLYDLGVRQPDVTAFCISIVQACQKADTSALPLKVSRRKTAGIPQAVSDTLAHYFKLLTGKPATVTTSPKDNKASGHFFRLVEDVFEALALEASPESCARGAVRKKRAQEKLAKSPFEDGLMGD